MGKEERSDGTSPHRGAQVTGEPSGSVVAQRQTLPHLRVSLYGDCNFRCTYCPPWGENSYQVGAHLGIDELTDVLRALSRQGFKVVKLTGGEPTLRRDLVEVISRSAVLFQEVRLITNGWNLVKIAPALKAAGLNVVELSIDALSHEAFDEITQTRGKLPKVLAGLESCLELDMGVQLNMVVMRHNRDQVEPMIGFISECGPVRLKLLELVYYEYPGFEYWKTNFVDMDEVTPTLEKWAQNITWETPPGAFGTPMRVFELANGSSVAVKDGKKGAVYSSVCNDCPLFPCQDGLYGLTLTADGMLKMCKHRPDLHIPVSGKAKTDAFTVAIDVAVKEVTNRYESAYFAETGWRPGLTESHAELQAVPPDEGVMKWYRRKNSHAVGGPASDGSPDPLPPGKALSGVP